MATRSAPIDVLLDVLLGVLLALLPGCIAETNPNLADTGRAPEGPLDASRSGTDSALDALGRADVAVDAEPPDAALPTALQPLGATPHRDFDRFAAAWDQMRQRLPVPGEAPLLAEAIGDPARFAASEATAPTEPGALASLYYETAGLRAAVIAAEERRPRARAAEDAGARLAEIIALDLRQGFTAVVGGAERGSADWHGRRMVHALTAFLAMAAWTGLEERSADGFDRLVALLQDDGGRPHGLGARVAEIDERCGTRLLETITAELIGARGPFAQALVESGLPDALDRLVILEGQSPRYDQAMLAVDQGLTEAIGLALGVVLLADPMTAAHQAEAQGLYQALHAKVVAQAGEAIDGRLAQGLDQADRAAIDGPALREALALALALPPCGR